MANIEKLIPHILLWENSISMKEGETLKQTFERARKKGVHIVKGDLGGPTLVGVTLATFQDWRRRQGKPTPTQADLAKLNFEEWIAILKYIFWDPCKADDIHNQSIANMLVDWRWVNGTQAIRDAQFILGLVTDGIVGPKTLGALNATPAASVFSRLKTARENAYRKIVNNRPTQQRFLNGWINRTNDIKYEE